MAYSPDEINFLKLKKKIKENLECLDQVDGKYWKNYLKAINRMEVILKRKYPDL